MDNIKESIKIFEEKWYISIIDVIEVLTNNE